MGGGAGQLLFVSLVDAISISNRMAKHRSAVSCSCRLHNVTSACKAGGSSSLHTRMNATARMMQTLRCRATDLKTSQRFLQHASNTHRTQALARQAQRTAQRAPLQPHLHSLYATTRHTLHHHLSPVPQPVGHVHIGRRSGQSLARDRNTAEHEAHSSTVTRRIFHENGAEGRQRFLPTVFPAWRSLRKKSRLGIDELEEALDLRAKLRGRPQLAVGDEGK
jgi:hypothetical protein